MQFGSLSLNANIFIFVVLGGFFLLAFLFGEARLKRIALAVIAGLFAADQLTNFVITQLDSVLKLTDPGIVRLGLLLLITLPLSLGKSPSVGGHFSVRSFGLALLMSATVIAYVHSFLPLTLQEQLSADFNLMAIATTNKLWWLSGMLGWLIILQLWKKKPKDDDVTGKKGKKGKKKR